MSTNWREIFNIAPDAWSRDFEREYSERTWESRAHTVLQMDMARYFFEFHPEATNLYRTFSRALRRENQIASTLVSLNYDLLLQRSLQSEAVPYFLPEVTAENDGVTLLLPHGASNLFDAGHNSFGNLILGGRFGAQLVIDCRVEEIMTEQAFEVSMGRGVPPAMSYFEPNKAALVGGSWLARQRSQVADRCRAAEQITIVGVAYREHDQHIWAPIVGSPAEVRICAGPSTSAQYAQFMKLRDASLFETHWQECFDDLLTPQ